MPYAPGTSEANKVWTVYQYDALGRTTSVKTGVTGAAPNGRGTTTYAYSTDTITTTDPKGNYKKFTRDVFGNLVTVAEKNPDGGADLLTTYTYTLRNQLTTATMTRGSTTQTRTFNYDQATGRLTSRTLPESGTTTFTYNAAGQLASQTDARGARLEYTWDDKGRLSVLRRVAANGVEESRDTYTFDLARLWRVNYGSFEEQYDYNSNGTIAAKWLRFTKTVAGLPSTASLAATYSFDPYGRVTMMAAPTANWNGDRFYYGYDSRGLPNSLRRVEYYNPGDPFTPYSGPGKYIFKNAGYDFAGRLTGLQIQDSPGRHQLLPGNAHL